jgi:peptide/nickel transport system substrate-binding protein
VAPGLVGHRAHNLIEKPDLEQAKKLLADAGFANGFKSKLDVQNTADHVAAAQVIQAQLAQVGIDVKINTLDSGTFWTLGIEKDNPGWKDIELIYNRYSMAPDPFWGTTWFTPEQVGIYNWERWNSKEFGDLDKAAVREMDPAKRGPIYAKMQDLMEESGAYIFVTHGSNAFIYRDSIVPAIRPDGGNHMFRKFKVA